MTVIPKLEARVRPHKDAAGRATKLLAFAELTIADSFVIKGIRVLQQTEEGGGATEPFVVFPAEKGKGANADRWYDIAHPCTAEARAAAIALILEEYAKAKHPCSCNDGNVHWISCPRAFDGPERL